MDFQNINITDDEFRRFSVFVKSNYGINLMEKKRALVKSRLYNMLLQYGFTSFTEYFDFVRSDKTGNSLNTLISKITTNHTFFMRESEHFKYFRNNVLPYLKMSVRTKDLGIWSAGCSSGEEPYTLAMIIDEFFSDEKMWWDTEILATDISSKVLDTARQGIYSSESIADIPNRWKINYFKKHDDDTFEIDKRIKKEVIFRKFNLMEEIFPFKRKFHVIFCRNVMIYFDNHTKNKLVNKFYDFTECGGYLFIGHSESINRDETAYKYIMPAVYRKE
mgnify:FL=1